MKNFILYLSVLLLLVSCDIVDNDDETNSEQQNMEDLDIPENFNYRTTKQIDVNISCLSADDSPIPNITFSLYDKKPSEGGNLLLRGATNTEGIYNTFVDLPLYFDSLTVQGFMTTQTIAITDNSLQYQIGGSNTSRSKGNFSRPRNDAFEYLTSYNENGVPEDLESDIISVDFLQRIDASLPEYLAVPTYHPDYLAEGSVLNIILEEEAEVWITFLHEGAGYQNSLGYYTYAQDNGAPNSVDSLQHTIIFPNASLVNSGGGLQPGDKVYLGTFSAGTVIGWFLVADGWSQNAQIVKENNTRYYSNPEYNPETDPDNQQHTVLLYDDIEEKMVLAFEDLERPGGDEDFNDAVFYVTANPVEAISTENVNPIDIIADQDEDGISDLYDDYPNDPERAFNNFYPGENIFGTLAFEDMWPQKGDYDFNDLVVEYNFKNVHTPQNRLKDVTAEIRVVAIGAGYHNSFAICLPFSNLVDEFVPGNWTVLEDDAEYLILKIFDDAYDLIPEPNQGYVNTEMDYPYYEPIADTFALTLESSIALEDLEYLPPYNPFIRKNGNMQIEIHLPDYPPTAIIDQNYFQTEDDDTDPDIGRYYKTTNNLPWAINIPFGWYYPLEKDQICWGYLRFGDWAESGGNQDQEWYFFEDDRIDEDYIYIPPR